MHYNWPHHDTPWATRKVKGHGTRSSLEEVRRGGPRGPRRPGQQLHRLHFGEQNRAPLRRNRHPHGRESGLHLARRRRPRGARAFRGRQGVGTFPRQGAHPGAAGKQAAEQGHEHPRRAHRQPPPRPEAEPALREQRLRASRHALLRRYQELPMGYAPARHARRHRQEGRHGRGHKRGRR